MAHRTPLRIGCFREIQKTKTLQESSYALMRQTITRLGYSGWKITDESIESACGSRIIFRGLKDIRAAGQVKGLEAFDIFWLEEAATISHDSLRMLCQPCESPALSCGLLGTLRQIMIPLMSASGTPLVTMPSASG